MADEIAVKGLSQLQAFLDQLPAKLERNIVRGGLRAGAQVIQAAARANVPVGAPSAENARLYGGYVGALRDSLRVSVRARGGTVIASVKAGGVVTKRGADLRALNTALWVEYGTKPHTITAQNRKGLSVGGLFFQSVHHPGAKPHPFMRPALDTQGQAAVVAAAEYMKQRLATKEGLDTSDVVIGGGA